MQDKGSQFIRREEAVESPSTNKYEYSPHGGLAKDEWGGGGSQTDTYHMTKGGRADMQLRVEHEGAKGKTFYRLPEGENDERLQRGYDLRQDRQANERGEMLGQQSLFNHESSHPSETVEYLNAADSLSGRTSAMTGLGMAANDAMSRGMTLMPSNDLSPYSNELTDRLGVTPDKIRRNRMGFESKDTVPGPHFKSEFDEVPASEVAQGKRTVRSVLGRKSRPMDQGSLF